jgi:acyl-coenzyme A synthetase/AMP-(fatty) acid ligase
MIPHYKNIHNRFKINGFHLEREALFQLAYSFIKEGAQFEREFGEFLLDWIDDKDTIQLMTSGTTGEPKLITMQKQAMVNSAILGGAKLSDTLAHQLQYCNAAVYETYGMTETITHIAAKRIGTDCFETLPNVSIAKDDRGCLIIQAPNIVSSTIVTNDLVEIISDNQFKWLGRFDNVINSGGIKYFPEQIEAKLALKINQRFFIAGLPDDNLGQRIALFIEGEKFPLEASIFNELEKFERPKEIHFIPNFIETNNKLKRFEMVNNQISLL